MARKYKRKIPNITHNGIINVWDYVSFEDYPNEYGKRIYLDISSLVGASEHEIQSNTTFPRRCRGWFVWWYQIKTRLQVKSLL